MTSSTPGPLPNPELPRPDEAQIREALRRYAPSLATTSIEFLGEGWSMWAFRAADHVLRFPKRRQNSSELESDRRLLPELVRHLTLAVPVPEIYGGAGPNDLPFTGHRLIPGISLISASHLLSASARGGAPGVPPSPSFGRELGDFLRQLHAFPVERAGALGVPLLDGPAFRARRIAFYEEIVRLAFPLISCEARTYTQARFKAYLNDSANFVFEPRLVHNDLDRQNLIIDPETGRLTGVIDFGDAAVSKPALDLWLPLVDFDHLGIADQLPDFLAAYADPALDLDRARIEAGFIQFLWPFHDISFGRRTGDDDLVAEGIGALNASLPPDLACP